MGEVGGEKRVVRREIKPLRSRHVDQIGHKNRGLGNKIDKAGQYPGKCRAPMEISGAPEGKGRAQEEKPGAQEETGGAQDENVQPSRAALLSPRNAQPATRN
jgi:hypothetical protein